jgi:chemotaxis protein methyltransferase CheR
MNKFVLSLQEFSIFTSLIEERVGFSYSLADKPIFESKLGAHLEDAGYASALDYYYYLRYDDADGRAFRELSQALTVHETFFFRELEPLRVAIVRLLKPRIDAGERVRVWCAASSTGEEPLSFAMLAASLDCLERIEILASDLSPAALAKARAGTFGPRAVRGPFPVWAEAYLRSKEGGYEVSKELIASIDWRELNLLDRAAIERLGPIDLILCRNVLIYFRDEIARRVVETLAARLRPGGSLLVGVSESLLRLNTDLHCEEHGHVFVYRKVAPA